ncbi:MAG TPA: HIT family protein [Burkholderiaceae bacterium]|nr:HIT family protein [Burkholderiaceae bacterium]
MSAPILNADDTPCPLCTGDGGSLILRTPRYRVIFADDPAYPCLVRVIWQNHVRELSDLLPAEQSELMQAVFTIERVMRNTLKPHKMNLASFGNMAPHVHWHLIPRWPDDAHFPQPTWAPKQREGVAHGAQQREALAQAICAALQPPG